MMLVLGVSSDSVESHQDFAKKQSLSFPLLADVNGSVRKAYKVPKKFFIAPGRVTFLIDKEGKVFDIFNSFVSNPYEPNMFDTVQFVSFA